MAEDSPGIASSYHPGSSQEFTGRYGQKKGGEGMAAPGGGSGSSANQGLPMSITRPAWMSDMEWVNFSNLLLSSGVYQDFRQSIISARGLADKVAELEAACAEMRGALEIAKSDLHRGPEGAEVCRNDPRGHKSCKIVLAALDMDAGKDYIAKSRIAELVGTFEQEATADSGSLVAAIAEQRSIAWRRAGVMLMTFLDQEPHLTK